MQEHAHHLYLLSDRATAMRIERDNLARRCAYLEEENAKLRAALQDVQAAQAPARDDANLN